MRFSTSLGFQKSSVDHRIYYREKVEREVMCKERECVIKT